MCDNDIFTFDSWIQLSFNKYSKGNETLNRHQMKCAVISLTGKKPVLPDKDYFTLNDLKQFIGKVDFASIVGDLNEIYESIDTDEKGYIRFNDLVVAANKYNVDITQKSLEEAFINADTDNDGMISYREFIDMARRGFNCLK